MDESGDNKIYLSSSLFGNHKKPQITLSPVRLQKVKGEEGFDGDKKSFTGGNTVWSVSKEQTTESIRSVHYSHSHSKKVIKHALRQQAKRRRKNTTIAAGNSAPVPRYVTTSLDNTEEELDNRLKEPTKMIDILSSIPDFRIKHRKRTNKKLSTAAQLEQTKEGCVDLETPDSILLQTNLRDLLNKHTFSSLPPFYQYKLIQLLPHVDRIPVSSQADCVYRLNPTGLSNEFFNRACTEWKERLAEGEFTPENQQKRKLEVERDKNKLDPWKVKHFEPIWGENSNVVNNTFSVPEKESVSPKPANKTPTKRPVSPVLRNRTVGAVTRSVSMYREKREAEDTGGDVKKFKPITCTETEKTVSENLEEDVDRTNTTKIPTICTDNNLTERTSDTVDAPNEDHNSLDSETVQHKQLSDDDVIVDIIVEEKPDLESVPTSDTHIEDVPIMEEVPIDDIDNDDNLLDHTIEIENIICEEDGNWNNDREEAAILAAAWDAVESGSESLLAEVDLDRDREEDIANQEKGEISPKDEPLQSTSLQEQETQLKQDHSSPQQWTCEDPVLEIEQIEPTPESIPSVDKDVSDQASPTTQVENQVTSTEEPKPETPPEESSESFTPEENKDEVVTKEETNLEHESSENATTEVGAPQEENSPKINEPEESEQTEVISEMAQPAVEPSETCGLDEDEEEEEEEKPQDDQVPNEENELLNETINIEKMICEGEAWDNSKEEQVQAAILAAAWDAVDSNTEKLLAEVAMEGDNEVAVIPMQEELEVRLEESSLPAPEWVDYDGKSEENSQSADDDQKPKPVQYTGGHVKLALEVTLTPEVDNQVTSTVEGGTSTSTNVITSSNTILAPSTVIPPTTIVCLPSTNPTVPTPPTTQLVTNQAVSSSALPYIALTTSTPVRAVPTKTQVKSGGRGGRNTSNKPPPGAVNLERSYQICQAVIQNSPNRDQLKFQLKPPPSLLLNKDNYKTQNATRGGHTKPTKTYNASSSKPSTLIKHVFHSPQGIPVTMAVLPTSNTELTESQMGQYLLVQRSGFGSGVRRSNSAPPTNQKSSYGVGGRGRPASVGLQQQQQGTQPPKMCTIVTSQNAQTYYSVPQKYGIGMNEDCSCRYKAMVICLKCGAFCHDDCIGPRKICVNCR